MQVSVSVARSFAAATEKRSAARLSIRTMVTFYFYFLSAFGLSSPGLRAGLIPCEGRGAQSCPAKADSGCMYSRRCSCAMPVRSGFVHGFLRVTLAVATTGMVTTGRSCLRYAR